MQETLFTYYNHLGFFNPYYFKSKNGLVIDSNFEQIIAKTSSVPYLDGTALMEIFNKGYIFGDRTLINGLSKSPWMAKPNIDNSDWIFDAPKFDEKTFDIKKISKTLLQLLKEEMMDYLNGKKTIGILLTGGMDSRITAGILDLLIENRHINDVDVIALTWGNKNSRDVVYSKQIANTLGWEWHHIELKAEDVFNNITETAIRGCEYSPIHLHGMIKIRNLNNLDCILATSFGDSIGRGEYSGRNLFNLLDVRSKIKNSSGILNFNILKSFNREINNDIISYHKRFPQSELHQQIEQDYQIHYMRRMLNPCMAVINERIPTFQMFTSPSVYNYIWSLNRKLRNNDIYSELINYLNKDLNKIPWARTGLRYDQVYGKPDSYDKNHDSYSEFLYNELNSVIKKLIYSNRIIELEIFNLATIEQIFKSMKRDTYFTDKFIESKLYWLASLSVFLEKFNIECDVEHYKNNFLNNNLNKLMPLKFKFINFTKKVYWADIYPIRRGINNW